MKKLIITGILITGFAFSSFAQERKLQYWRPYDQRGINIFENPKADTVEYDGLKVQLGGSFTQQFQSLNHSTTAEGKYDDQDRNLNQLMEIGPGFNLATANLNLDVQLADGVRLNLITYLSSRHHPETWVKGGFIQVDKLPFLKSEALDKIMEFTTIRVGHMEINYGDAHFRRTDNAHAMYNPFVGNYILDAFTTEIGAEVYVQKNGFLAMAAMTNGEIQGGVTNPGKRKPSLYGKLGYDSQINEDLRLRLTGSIYTTAGSVNNTLYAGDRAGSRYYMVMENFLATTAANFTSGRINPGLRDNVTAWVVNPFVKFHGLEFFGNFEQARGKAANETEQRTWNQLGADFVYRFGNVENFYVAARYNTLSGALPATDLEATINRIQVGGGWFVTRNILAKVEYVNQQYKDFPAADIRNGGLFKGFVVEGVIAF